MKSFKNSLLFGAFGLLLCAGCEKSPARLTFLNRITNTEIRRVIWTDYQLASRLLPGQSSESEFNCYPEKEWPRKGVIEFEMSLNGKTIYVKTKEVVELDCEESLQFELNDSTAVEIF